jgi:hypothetical protein
MRVLSGLRRRTQRRRAVKSAHHIDPLHRHPCAAQQSFRQLTRRCGDREHRAVMVTVGVDIQQADAGCGPARERSADRGDRALVAPLGDIRYGEQDRRRHRRHEASVDGP